MKKLLVFSFCIFSLVSCVSDNEPHYILPQEKMVEVLIDIHLTEGKVKYLPFSDDSLQVLYTLLENDVFLKHKVSDSIFTHSMRYYMDDLSEMEQIYARVYDSLYLRVNGALKIDPN